MPIVLPEVKLSPEFLIPCQLVVAENGIVLAAIPTQEALANRRVYLMVNEKGAVDWGMVTGTSPEEALAKFNELFKEP